jgi:hypothetical protein
MLTLQDKVLPSSTQAIKFLCEQSISRRATYYDQSRLTASSCQLANPKAVQGLCYRPSH